MNNLIIGVNSFLGKELCHQLVSSRHNVIGVYHKNTNNLLPNIDNITIEEMFKSTLEIDNVYLVSAYVPIAQDGGVEDRLRKVNVEFVRLVCEKFKTAKIVFCSTISVYKVSSGQILENSNVFPDSLYGKSKLLGEKIVMKNLNYSIVRISSMFGVGMKETTFLPAIINNAINTGTINLLGDGNRMQNYVSVIEVAKYLIESSKKGNRIYLATGTKSYSNKEIAEKVRQVMKSINITFSGVDKSKSYHYDNSFTRNELKIKDNVNFTESLKELIEWQIKKF